MYEEMHEEMFDEVFDETCRHVEYMRDNYGMSREDLQGLLDSEYIRQGNDMEGRSEVANVKLHATIAAYEHILAGWDR